MFILTSCILCIHKWHIVITLLIYIALVPAKLFLSERGRGVGLSLRFIISPPTWPVLYFSVMSELNLDNLGFQSPGAPPSAPLSSGSSSDSTADRRKCESCHRWMSKKTFDRHSLCVSCRGSECDIDHCCEECADWPEEDVLLYVKHRRTLKYRRSKVQASSSSSSSCGPFRAFLTILYFRCGVAFRVAY